MITFLRYRDMILGLHDIMRKKDDTLMMLTLLVVTETALMTRVSENAITVQPGPVEAKQEHNVSLWCKMKYDPKKEAPVTWQSPPNFKTRADDCHSFKKGKYFMSCSDGDPFEYYNLTILDVEWADKGKYRCMYSKHEGTVDLQVLVPVTEVTLKKVVTSTAADPLSMHVCITCETNCAYPAARISWFENDQPFSGNTTVTELGCLADKEGQKRTISDVSMVTGKDKYKDNERKGYSISCTAENIIGEPTISKAIAIKYDVMPNLPPTMECEVHSQTAIKVELIPPYTVLAVLIATIMIVLIWRKKRHDKKNRPVTRTGTSGRGDPATQVMPGDDGAEVNKEEKLVVFGQTSTHPPEGCESLGLKLINLNINDIDDAESDDLTAELHL